MAKNRIKFNSAGFRELLNSPGVRADLERRGAAIEAEANREGEHTTFSESGRGRARVAVVTTSFEAMRAEREGLNLTRSIDAGRR